MNGLSFSKEEQIELLLALKLSAELEKRFPNTPDSWKLVTATKADVLAYFKANPGTAAEFFARCGFGNSCPNWHDVPVVWKDGGTYKTAWTDHGKPVDAVSHASLDEALTEYISQRYLGG